jgi:hypothetical protein
MVNEFLMKTLFSGEKKKNILAVVEKGEIGSDRKVLRGIQFTDL